MPFVRIDMRRGRSEELRAAIGDAIHRAMVLTLNVPADDRFQVITEHPEGGVVADPAYLGVARGEGVLLVQITLNAGRTVEMKKAFYARAAEHLAELGVRREDLLISLVEVSKENWSFGKGVAQYA